MMEVWSMTDVGLVRKENQDACAVCQHEESGHTLCVVCDGMGGAAGGKLASRIAVDTFMTEMQKVLRRDMTPEQLREASSYAVVLANRAIRDAAEASVDCRGMGTTLVSALTNDGGAVHSNVGDSRAYHITSEGISQISRDHSVVENLVAKGDITPQEARRHPNRNLITRALGPDISAKADTFALPWRTEEYILLCTDGLVNTVSDQEMLFEVLHDGDVDGCLEHLLQISLQRGAPDNVTAVLLLNDQERS